MTMPPAVEGSPSGSQNLTAQTLSGIQWTYMGTAASSILQLGSAAILGRLLAPEDFGLLAMAMLVSQFTYTFARMGIGPALIQKPKLTADEIRAGFTGSVGLGVLFASLFWLTAPLVARAFTEPNLVPVLRVMGFALVLFGLGLTSESLLRRQMRFRETEILSVLSYAVGYLGVGAISAALGAGVWSLVAANLVQTGVMSLLCLIRARHSLRPILRWSAYRHLFGFGSRVSLISVLEYIGLQLDTFAVGRYAAAAALGQYNRAFVIAAMPLRKIAGSLSKVLFPSFSKIQNDRERMRRAHFSAVSASAAILLPICAGIAVAAREIVLVVLGLQWEPVIAILPFVAVASSFGVLTHFAAVVTEAQGELHKKMVLQASYLVVLALFLVPAIGRDLWAYAAAFALAKLVQHVAYVLLLRHTIGLRLAEYTQAYARAVFGAAIVGAAVVLGRQATLASGASTMLILAVEILVGAVSLIMLFRFGNLRPVGRQILERLDQAQIPAKSAPGRVASILLGRP